MISEFESSIPKFQCLEYKGLEFKGLQPGGLDPIDLEFESLVSEAQGLRCSRALIWAGELLGLSKVDP
jgi:hypothetical protein